MNPWVEHVLKEAARLAISYVSALVDERVKASYKAKKEGIKPIKIVSLPTRSTKTTRSSKSTRGKPMKKKK